MAICDAVPLAVANIFDRPIKIYTSKPEQPIINIVAADIHGRSDSYLPKKNIYYVHYNIQDSEHYDWCQPRHELSTQKVCSQDTSDTKNPQDLYHDTLLDAKDSAQAVPKDTDFGSPYMIGDDMLIAQQLSVPDINLCMTSVDLDCSVPSLDIGSSLDLSSSEKTQDLDLSFSFSKKFEDVPDDLPVTAEVKIDSMTLENNEEAPLSTVKGQAIQNPLKWLRRLISQLMNTLQNGKR